MRRRPEPRLALPRTPQRLYAPSPPQSGALGWWSGLTNCAPANALATLLTVPVLGLLSDHVGRKPVFVLSLVMGAAVLFDLPLWVLFISRTLSGTTSAAFCMAYAYVADVSEPHRRSQNFGLLVLA